MLSEKISEYIQYSVKQGVYKEDVYTAIIKLQTSDESIKINQKLQSSVSYQDLKKQIALFLKSIYKNTQKYISQITTLTYTLNKNEDNRLNDSLSHLYNEKHYKYKKKLPIILLEDKINIKNNEIIGNAFVHIVDLTQVIFIVHIAEPQVYNIVSKLNLKVTPIYTVKKNIPDKVIMLGVSNIKPLIRR